MARRNWTRYRKGVLKEVGAFERFVFNLPRLSELDNLLIKINIPINATLFILISMTLGMIGFGIGYLYLPQHTRRLPWPLPVCWFLISC